MTQAEFEKKLKEISPEAEAEFERLRSDETFVHFLSSLGIVLSEFEGRDYPSTNPYLVYKVRTYDHNERIEAEFKKLASLNRCTLPNCGVNSFYRLQIGSAWIIYFPYAGEFQASLYESQSRPFRKR